jgi:hypothetical protein
MLSKPVSKTLHHHAAHAIRYYNDLGTMSLLYETLWCQTIQLRHNEV